MNNTLAALPGPEGNPLSWGYVAVAAATVVGGYMSNKGAKDAASQQRKGLDAAAAEQARQFDVTQENMKPWLEAGQNALSKQTAFLNGDMSQFTASPDYQWRLGEGTRALENSAASRGNLFGGGTQTDLTNYAQGAASQEVNNWWNRLAGVSGTGQNTANQLGGYGQNYANQQGNNAINAANATASSYQQQAQNNQQTIGQLANLWGQYQGSRATGT